MSTASGTLTAREYPFSAVNAWHSHLSINFGTPAKLGAEAMTFRTSPPDLTTSERPPRPVIPERNPLKTLTDNLIIRATPQAFLSHIFRQISPAPYSTIADIAHATLSDISLLSTTPMREWRKRTPYPPSTALAEDLYFIPPTILA